MKYEAAARRRRPITCLMRSLAGPVRGIFSIHAGFAERTR
jgi:hypothetical protein